VGFVWALATGHWEASLGVAVFFELFWLDLLPVGTYVPPQSVAATVAALSLIHYYHAVGPGELALPLFLALPVALAGSRLEFNLRKWQDRSYNALLRHARRSATGEAPFDPGRLVAVAVAQAFAANFAFFAVSLVILVQIMGWLNDNVIKGMHFPLEWGHLWFLAAMGGILSLRVRRAFGMLAAGVAAVVVLSVI
jgi:PTS system mannose-specific IIC component